MGLSIPYALSSLFLLWKQAIISIGATRYTEFGETHFLQPNDLSIVAVYDGEKYSAEEIEKMARDEKFADDISALIQKVV